MKKVVPFTKTITFRTMIAEVTDIEVKHTLELKENNEIEGDILVDGKYKMTDASQIEEEFHYKLPFLINVDSRYDTNDLNISIGDFYFEIINEEDLKVNVDIDLDGLVDKNELELESIRNKLEEIEIPVETHEDIKEVELIDSDDPLDKLEQEIKEDIKEETIPTPIASTTITQTNNTQKNTTETTILENIETKDDNSNKSSIGSIFSSLTSNEETFSTYHVYIVRESDTIEGIMDKYKVTRDDLASYNDLDNVKFGTKLIIPCSND